MLRRGAPRVSTDKHNNNSNPTTNAQLCRSQANKSNSPKSTQHTAAKQQQKTSNNRSGYINFQTLIFISTTVFCTLCSPHWTAQEHLNLKTPTVYPPSLSTTASHHRTSNAAGVPPFSPRTPPNQVARNTDPRRTWNSPRTPLQHRPTTPPHPTTNKHQQITHINHTHPSKSAPSSPRYAKTLTLTLINNTTLTPTALHTDTPYIDHTKWTLLHIQRSSQTSHTKHLPQSAITRMLHFQIRIPPADNTHHVEVTSRAPTSGPQQTSRPTLPLRNKHTPRTPPEDTPNSHSDARLQNVTHRMITSRQKTNSHMTDPYSQP